MRFEQEKRKLARIKAGRFCKGCKCRWLIDCKFLVVSHKMAAGAPTICEGLSIIGIGSE
jgi:hypothetical protein